MSVKNKVSAKNVSSKNIDQGFAPILGEAPRILVLGTMPSVASISSQQYYGHPRNSFWWIMSVLCEFDPTISYDLKVAAAKRAGVAVWDVVHSCHRPGSLDSNIDEETLTPNAILPLLSRLNSISMIAFNGQAAHRLFKKYIGLTSLMQEVVILPSTSPANASMKREEKLSHWLTLQRFMR